MALVYLSPRSFWNPSIKVACGTLQQKHQPTSCKSNEFPQASLNRGPETVQAAHDCIEKGNTALENEQT